MRVWISDGGGGSLEELSLRGGMVTRMKAPNDKDPSSRWVKSPKKQEKKDN